MEHRPRVLVVGAGVVGSSLAWRLAARGASVTVLEAEFPGAGSSSTSFAWVNASSKVDSDHAYFELNASATREHHVLARAFPESNWFFASGNVELALDVAEAPALESKVARLRDAGYQAELLSTADLERLEPGIDVSADGGAAHYADEGWVDAPGMVHALVGFAKAAGAEFVCGGAVTELLVRGGAIKGLRVASGDSIEADIVVSAAGRWTQALLAQVDAEIPLVAIGAHDSTAVGLLATVYPSSGPPRRVLHSHRAKWAPQPRGGALLASMESDAATARDRSPSALQAHAEALLEQAATLSRRFVDATIDEVRVGFRAIPVDGRTVCGWLDSVEGLYVVVTHSGITLAPLLSQLVARELLELEAVPTLDPFRPGRFKR
jgi:glycine/D-amino acid oxidase-like deaminating enzyme